MSIIVSTLYVRPICVSITQPGLRLLLWKKGWGNLAHPFSWYSPVLNIHEISDVLQQRLIQFVDHSLSPESAVQIFPIRKGSRVSNLEIFRLSRDINLGIWSPSWRRLPFLSWLSFIGRDLRLGVPPGAGKKLAWADMIRAHHGATPWRDISTWYKPSQSYATLQYRSQHLGIRPNSPKALNQFF